MKKLNKIITHNKNIDIDHKTAPCPTIWALNPVIKPGNRYWVSI